MSKTTVLVGHCVTGAVAAMRAGSSRSSLVER